MKGETGNQPVQENESSYFGRWHDSNV